MSKIVGCLLLFLLFNTSLLAQETLSLTPPPEETELPIKLKNQFIPFPVLGNAPETGFQYGVGATYTYFLDQDLKRTRNSYLSSYNMFSTKNQMQLALQNSTWLKGNKWNINATISYSDAPIYFYGIGNNTKEYNQDLIVYHRLKFISYFKRQILNNLYLGTGLWLQYDDFGINDDGYFANGNFLGAEGGTTALIGFGAAYDTRDSENSAMQGILFQTYYWQGLNIGEYRFNAFKVDYRHFIRTSPKGTISFNTVFQTVQGSAIPFFYLPSLGSEALMRGYYTGRYRDQNLLGFQSEYRYWVWGHQKDRGWFSPSRLCAAVFAGTGQVYSNGEFAFNEFKPNFGGGIRYMFEHKAKMVLRLDYGIGSQNPGEARSTGIYIGLNEAF